MVYPRYRLLDRRSQITLISFQETGTLEEDLASRLWNKFSTFFTVVCILVALKPVLQDGWLPVIGGEYVINTTTDLELITQ